MKNFVTYSIWTLLSVLSAKYSVELGFDKNIGWISPLLGVICLQLIFSVFALFASVLIESKTK
jgi:hypothetical protein